MFTDIIYDGEHNMYMNMSRYRRGLAPYSIRGPRGPGPCGSLGPCGRALVGPPGPLWPPGLVWAGPLLGPSPWPLLAVASQPA